MLLYYAKFVYHSKNVKIAKVRMITKETKKSIEAYK